MQINLPFISEYSPTELAWLAGFLDGEGSIGIHSQRGGRNARLQVQVGNTHKPTMDVLASKYHRTLWSEDGNGTRKRMWRTCWSGRDAYNLLFRLLPYLVTKRRQAELALEYLATMTKAHRPVAGDIMHKRTAIQNELRVINARGIR